MELEDGDAGADGELDGVAGAAGAVVVEVDVSDDFGAAVDFDFDAALLSVR